MAPSRNSTRNIKSEAVIKVNGGLVTPNSSISTGTTSPKAEDAEISFSDITEANFESFQSHDGLPREQDEAYFSQVNYDQARKIRSSAPSFRSSRYSIDLTGMEELQAPGASLRIVGEKVNLLVTKVKELHELGLQELNTELPELVLVGDQSAGKSTLMSAIAEIHLPNGDGMCTRCPANITTSPAGTWSCTVSLLHYYDFSRDPGPRNPTKNNPFPPWKEKPDGGIEKIHFKTISEKKELEKVLRWAQVALLNPNQDPKLYIPGTGAKAQRGLKPEKHEADFSPNLVGIEISGPGLPALSFYDLPGVIATGKSDEEQYLVKVFRFLAEKYINHKNALVICAMAMHNDPGVSNTVKIIKDLKAEKRCIGVLTKPDRLQAGSHDYDALLRGKAYDWPGLGYFVTKQPGPDFQHREGDYHAQARREEDEFFNTDTRWQADWADFRASGRCGTAAIQKYLSEQFANQIIKSMPNIDAKIKAQANEVEDALNALPELPGVNVQHVVRSHLQEFSGGVRKLFEGGPGLLSSWSQLSNDFRDTIQAMKPEFDYTDPSDMDMPESFVPDPDPEVEFLQEVPRSGSKRPPPQGMETPQQKKSKTFQDSPIQMNGMRAPKQERNSDRGSPSPVLRRTQSPFDIFLGAGKGFMSIAQIRQVIQEYQLPGHPDHVDDNAKEDICMRSVQPWNGPLESFTQHTFRMLKAAILSILDKTLGHYKQTQLYRASRQYIIDFLAQHEVEQRQKLQDIYKLETYKMFTINNSVFMTYKGQEFSKLGSERRKWLAHCYVEKQAKMANKILTGKARADEESKVTNEQLKLGRDPFRNEIELAGYVRGYYKIAGFRFAENVCHSIQGNIFRDVHKGITRLLEHSFELDDGDGEAKCRILMVENEREAEQRRALKAKQEKLIEAANSLADLVRRFREENPDPVHEDDRMEEDLIVQPSQSRQSNYQPPFVLTATPNGRIIPDTNGY